MKALVVGGTGPTGPYIVNGLLERGYDVAIFHRGAHEIDEIPPQVEHIHGDPHFLETINESLQNRRFDLAIVTYGRVRHLAEALVGKVGRFISVGGVACYRGFLNPEVLHPQGLPVPMDEDTALTIDESEQRFSYLIAQTENAVLAHHPSAAHFRYPYVYGPRQLVPREWCIVRRVLDKRRRLIVADGGLGLSSHGFSANLAHSVLLAADKPEESSGQIYNCADDEQRSAAQIIHAIAAYMGHEFELINMPYELALPTRPFDAGMDTQHRLMDTSKIKRELGYEDVTPIDEALKITINWLLKNRPQPGDATEQRLQDPFDYVGEDTLIAEWEVASRRLQAVPFEMPAERPHPYAHPKKPGERDHRNR